MNDLEHVTAYDDYHYYLNGTFYCMSEFMNSTIKNVIPLSMYNNKINETIWCPDIMTLETVVTLT